ncbi:hypothetical protein CYY_000234 [Polysphondylium violaceum]|uniref:FNIP repeat-containing protein n=1 Tax=Polysphondylium violaceum TaxID=133409 RepID=A0A8J4Q428_9MYCE|nr:hypothetical protein CYY_000234 [Polysphondylium violaceum]
MTGNIDLFYKVYRNTYIRNIIRANVLRDLIINVGNLDYLTDNHNYLETLSTIDKIHYNIFIRFEINDPDTFAKYTSHPYRHLITCLDLSFNIFQHMEDDVFDCDLVPQEVQMLSFYTPATQKGKGTLPQSLTDLRIRNIFSNSKSWLIDDIMANLPRDLKYLLLPSYDIEAPGCVLPANLSRIDYKSNVGCLKNLVGPTDRVIEGIEVQVESAEDLDWIENNKWVNSINTFRLNFADIQIPLHIRKLTGYFEVNTKDVPSFIESLTCNSLNGSLVSPNIKHIRVSEWLGKLEKGILPVNLESLDISEYNFPIEDSVLPSNLQVLNLGTFDQPLELSALPNSLTKLTLFQFNQPFPSLPNQLKVLNIPQFTQKTIPIHLIPSSLTRLELNSFDGIFENAENGSYQFNHLVSLSVHNINKSISNILFGSKFIKIGFGAYDNDVCLQPIDPSIRNLCLFFKGESDINLYPNFLPKSLIKVQLVVFDFFFNLETNSIPEGCKFLEINNPIDTLNQEVLPKSIKSIKCIPNPFIHDDE